MGEATITANKGAGLYEIEIKKDAGKSTNRLAILNQELLNYPTLLATYTTALNTATSAKNVAFNNMLAVESSYLAGVATIEDYLTSKKNYMTALNNEKKCSAMIEYLKLKKISIEKEINILTNAMASEIIKAYCVDYSAEMAVGKKVATLELNMEDVHINISAGGNTDEAIGLLQPAAVSTPAGVFYNLAIMPLVQRWLPTYRSGRITSIDYQKGTCSVTLDEPNYSDATKICKNMASNYKNIEINQLTSKEIYETVLNNISIKYMNNNYEVFESGDHVIVEFGGHNWNISPDMKVIGFYTNPKKPVDVIKIQLTDTVANELFNDLCDTYIGLFQSLSDFYTYGKDVFSPDYIAKAESLLGKRKGGNIVLWVFEVWTEEDIDNLANPEREWIGIDVYGDSQRNFYNAIASDLIDYYANLIYMMTLLKAAGSIMNETLYIEAYGHTYTYLDTDRATIETAVVKIETILVSSELTALKNPAGESAYTTKRNLNYDVKQLWDNYTGYVEVGAVNNLETVIHCEAHGFNNDDLIIINRYDESFPPELVSGSTYSVVVIDVNNINVKDSSGTLVSIAPTEEIRNLRIRLKNVVPPVSITLTSIYSGVTLCDFKFYAVGILDSTGEFYLLIYNPQFESSFINLSPSVKLTLFAWADGQESAKQTMYEYPNEMKYGCVHWNIKNIGYTDDLTLNFSIAISCRCPAVPTSFGATTRVTQTPTSSSVAYGLTIDIDNGGFFDMITRGSFFEPSGFFWFASKYYDHPLVTGEDNHTVTYQYAENMTQAEKDALDTSKLSIVEAVNAYVNTEFEYRLDIDEQWDFMGNGLEYGDCEDFAITKVQMLLNLGFPIADFKLQAGYELEPVDWRDHRRVGHLWVLYKNQYVLDIDTNTLKTQAEMLAIWQNTILQVRGLTWTAGGVEYSLNKDSLWIMNEFNNEIITGKLVLGKFVNQ